MIVAAEHVLNSLLGEGPAFLIATDGPVPASTTEPIGEDCLSPVQLS